MIGAQLLTLYGRNGYKNHVPVYNKNGELMGFIPWASLAKGVLKIGGGIFKGIKKAVDRKRAEKGAKVAAAAEQARALQAQAQVEKTKLAQKGNIQKALMIGVPALGLAALLLLRK